MKYSENMLAIPLWIRKYIYEQKPKNFFERFLKKVNIIAVKTQKFKNQNSSKNEHYSKENSKTQNCKIRK